MVKVPSFGLMARWPSGGGEACGQVALSQCRKCRFRSNLSALDQRSCQHQAVMRMKFSVVRAFSSMYSLYEQ